MLLDTTDYAWHMFLSITQKAKEAHAIWRSPKQERLYKIKDVLADKIVIRRDGGQDSELGKRGYLHFLEHFNNNEGRFSRKDHNGHVAKMACIVNFHPLLEWIDNNDYIQVINNASQGLVSYKDYGPPPNDDISQLQTFARKVRKGQSQFRQALFND
jgi:hypothetical protein